MANVEKINENYCVSLIPCRFGGELHNCRSSSSPFSEGKLPRPVQSEVGFLVLALPVYSAALAPLAIPVQLILPQPRLSQRFGELWLPLALLVKDHATAQISLSGSALPCSVNH